MICERCHQNQATVKITQVVNGNKNDLRLCQDCAEHLGLNNPFLAISVLLGGVIFGFLQKVSAPDFETETYDLSLTCERCGLSLREFKKTGLLGCSHCYQTFQKELVPILRRVHGRSYQFKRKPKPGVRVQRKPTFIRLEAELKRAVAEEDYEEAARLRDQIEKLKSVGKETV